MPPPPPPPPPPPLPRVHTSQPAEARPQVGLKKESPSCTTPRPALSAVPSPPPSSPPTGGQARVGPEFDDQTTLNPEDFAPFVPTFFVPVAAVLAELPGDYTAAHLEKYLAPTKAFQFIHFGAQCYLRIHGYFGYFAITGAAEANARYPQFEPRPELAEPLLRRLPPRGWIPLRELLETAPAEAVAALPFRGPESLFFFAQQQHLFNFATEDDGRVSRATRVFLGPDTTPCPLTVNDAFIKTLRNPLDVQAFLAALEPASRIQLFSFFPSVPAWAEAHSQYFHFDPATKVVQQERDRAKGALRNSSLDQQLEEAYRTQNKKKIRTLRRKQQTLQDPENPLLDRQNLIKAVEEFLPPDRHVTLYHLMHNLPNEIVNMMPNTYTKFFRNNPNIFTLFEFKSANRFCVQRAGLPLPDGALRREFTERELLDVIVERMQRKSSQLIEEILLNISDGARNAIKKQYTSLAALLAKYPQQFAMVNMKDKSMAGLKLVTLLSSEFPSEAESTEGDDTEQ